MSRGGAGSASDAPRVGRSGHSYTVSIVVPAFEEAQRLPVALERIATHLGARRARTEILIVDDGSADDTGAVAQRRGAELGLHLRVLRHEPNRGKGFAVRRGMLAARGDAVLLSDADLSVDIDHLEPFLERLEAGAAVVSGSRRLPGARIEVRQSRGREFLGAAFRSLAAVLLAPGVTDFTCGFKLFRRGAAREIFGRQRIWGWGYDAEILFLARRLGFEVAEAPVVWRDDHRSRVRLLRDVPRSLLDLAHIRWNALLGRYTELGAEAESAGSAGPACAEPRSQR